MCSTKQLRIWGFLIDYLVWYLIMVVMILFSFIFIYHETAFAGNLSAYQLIFDRIMHKPGFIVVYIAFLILYEIAVPLITNGQTLSKKIMHIKVSETSSSNLCIRGFLKIIMINPCGIIAFSIGVFFGQDIINTISDLLLIFLVVNILAYAMNKNCIHSVLSKTNILSA